MSLSTEAKKQIVAEYARSKDDTGSPEVQIALLLTTSRITLLFIRRISTVVAVFFVWLLKDVNFSTTSSVRVKNVTTIFVLSLTSVASTVIMRFMPYC